MYTSTYTNALTYARDSSLQTLDVVVVDVASPPHKPWVIYVHGGAWRDPRITSASFDTTRSNLLSSPAVAAHVAGLASLNYRLSPPSDPSSVPPADERDRCAKHPDHVNDVLQGIAHLQKRFGFGSKYILAGHSVGATLALQVAMTRHWTRTGPGMSSAAAPSDCIPPIAVVGVEGIYDIPALIEYNASEPAYTQFTEGAFGPRHVDHPHSGPIDVWRQCSPTSGMYDAHSWPQGRHAMLVHSKEDELVEWEQAELMRQRLRHVGWLEIDGNVPLPDRPSFQLYEVQGKHDEIWHEGVQLARAIERAVELISPLL